MNTVFKLNLFALSKQFDSLIAMDSVNSTRKQPSKFYKFFLVFIDVFINNYDIVDCFGIKLRSNGLCHSSFRQASRGQNFRNSGRENPDF